MFIWCGSIHPIISLILSCYGDVINFEYVFRITSMCVYDSTITVGTLVPQICTNNGKSVLWKKRFIF